MRILGVYAGIGSPMVKAQLMGHEIVGNIEPRLMAHVFDEEGRNTFLENFPGAWIVRKFEEVPKEELQDIDIICGHPKCGSYSNLINKAGQDRIDYMAKKSDDFLEFIRIVNKVKPKMAFFDNLPKSLQANPPELYRNLLVDYDVHVEYVSNYYYGNSQVNRNRLFIIATLKELEYEFCPGEKPSTMSMEDAIGDLAGKEGTIPNHQVHNIKGKSNSGRRVFQDGVMTWEQVAETMSKIEGTGTLHYFRPDGEKKFHFGFRKPRYNFGTPTLIGTHPIIHPETNYPISLRERARVQGFPDDFIFYGLEVLDDGTWLHNKNGNMIKQTGRCIPCEFPGFLIHQFEAFLNNDPDYTCSFKRLAKPNKYVQYALEEIEYENI